MTVSLSASAPFKTLHRLLLRLDESTPDAEVITKGPFAVFRACDDAVLAPMSLSSEQQPRHCISRQTSQRSQIDFRDDSRQFDSPNGETVELVSETLPADLNAEFAAFTSNDAIDALFPDLFPGLEEDATHPSLNLPDAFMDLPDIPSFDFANSVALSPDKQLPCFSEDVLEWSSPPIIEMPSTQSALPSEAIFLLANYKDTVIGKCSRRKAFADIDVSLSSHQLGCSAQRHTNV